MRCYWLFCSSGLGSWLLGWALGRVMQLYRLLWPSDSGCRQQQVQPIFGGANRAECCNSMVKPGRWAKRQSPLVGHWRFPRLPRSCWICRRTCGCALCPWGVHPSGYGWSAPASLSAGWTCAVRYIRAPDRALTTLTKPPGKLLQGVNPEYP